MPLTDAERNVMSNFLERVKDRFASDERFSNVSDSDPGAPESEPPAPEIWLEYWEDTWVRVNPPPGEGGPPSLPGDARPECQRGYRG